VKKVRLKKSKILEIWCRVKGNRWLIEKLERWPYVSRTKGQGFKTKSESAENYSKIGIERLMTINKNVRSTRSL
jgi:hypothetical protein